MSAGPTALGQGARAVAHGFVSLPHPCQPVSLTPWCHQGMGGLCLGGQASSTLGGCGSTVVGTVGAQQ